MPDYDGRLPHPDADHIDLVACNDAQYIGEFRHLYDPRWKSLRLVLVLVAFDVLIIVAAFFGLFFDSRFALVQLVALLVCFPLAGYLAYRRSNRDSFLAQAWERCYADPRWEQVIIVHDLLVEWVSRLYRLAIQCRNNRRLEDRQLRRRAVYEFQLLRRYHELLCRLVMHVEDSIVTYPLGCAEPCEGFEPPTDKLVSLVRSRHVLITEELQELLHLRAKIADDYKLPPRDAQGVLVQPD